MNISIFRTGNMASGLAAGCRPAGAGGLSAARYPKPVTGLNISLGHGADIAPIWQGIA